MKKMYKDVDIIYWANCCGDINLPSDPKEKNHPPFAQRSPERYRSYL